MSGRLFDPTSRESFQSRAIVPQVASSQVGAATAQFFGAAANVAFDLMEAQQRAEAADAETRARSTMTRGMADLRAGLREGDPSTIRERWESGIAALRQQATEQVPERHRGRVSRLAQQLQDAEYGRVVELQAQRTGDVARANTLAAVDGFVRSGVEATDPQDRARAVEQIDATLRTAVEAGTITAEAAERLRQGARRNMDRGMATRAVRNAGVNAPAVARAMPAETDEDRAELATVAAETVAARVAEAEAEEQRVTVARTALVDETVSRAMGGAGSPPSVDEVMALRFDMPPGRFRAVLAAASGRAPERDDPSEVGAALMNLDGADLEDQLDDALARGDMTPATRTRLMEERQALRADPVLRARRADAQAAIERVIPRCGTDDECDEMYGPEGVTDIAGGVLDEWMAWARANPQAGLRDVEEARALFAQRARDRVVRRIAGRLDPLPGVQRSGTTPYGMSEIEAFENDVLEALDAGQMGDGDASWWLSLANQWRAIAPDADVEVEGMDASGGARSGGGRR
jgi:hypothetical protein